VLTCVGSLSKAVLRLAGQSEATLLEGDFEIVSLVGTLSQNGVHLHLTIADKNGVVLGGHLLDGARVRTTAELVLGIFSGMTFDRTFDPITGYSELEIR
jgi:uncharacterized protein